MPAGISALAHLAALDPVHLLVLSLSTSVLGVVQGID